MNFKTSTVEELMKALDDHEWKVSQLRAELNRRKFICRGKHQYVPKDPYDPSDEWFTSNCHCKNCGKVGSAWYCPKSPDGMCEYDEEEDPNCDSCLHCGLPDERK